MKFEIDTLLHHKIISQIQRFIVKCFNKPMTDTKNLGD
jgi:hypothetical protein